VKKIATADEPLKVSLLPQKTCVTDKRPDQLRRIARVVVGWEHVGTAFPHLFALSTLKHGCNLTDVLATPSFALLVKSLGWNRKVQCWNLCRRILSLFKLFAAVFFFIWCGNGVPIPFF